MKGFIYTFGSFTLSKELALFVSVFPNKFITEPLRLLRGLILTFTDFLKFANGEAVGGISPMLETVLRRSLLESSFGPYIFSD